MFGKLIDGINDDYLRYVFHVQVLAERPPAGSRPGNYIAADDPVRGRAITAAFARRAGRSGPAAGAPGSRRQRLQAMVTNGWPRTVRPSCPSSNPTGKSSGGTIRAGAEQQEVQLCHGASENDADRRPPPAGSRAIDIPDACSLRGARAGNTSGPGRSGAVRTERRSPSRLWERPDHPPE